jgi:signal transduction histidine kinase
VWNKAIVGTNMIDRPDERGKVFRREMVEKALKDGGGVVDYVYRNPVSGNLEEKEGLFSTARRFHSCCGRLSLGICLYDVSVCE